MTCKHCGKEIADDSIFCEHCGKQVSAMPQRVDSALVAWIMFLLIICFSAAEMVCIESLISAGYIEYFNYAIHFVVIPTFLLICFVNVGVFISSIVLAKKKQLRTATAFALCWMSAFLVFGAFLSIETMYSIENAAGYARIEWNQSMMYSSILLAGIVAGLYAIYWVIARIKQENSAR